MSTEKTVVYQNSEVSISINGGTAFTALIPIDKSKMKSLQSVKCKSMDNIRLALALNSTDEADAKIESIGKKYRELIEPGLKTTFPGLKITYTEKNELLTFRNVDNNVYKQLTFELDCTKTEE